MSNKSHNGFPPPPHGVRERDNSVSHSDMGNIVPFGTPTQLDHPKPAAVSIGFVLCVLSGFMFAVGVTFLAAALLGYGYVVVAARGKHTARLVALLLTLAPVAALSGLEGMSILPTCAAIIALAEYALRGKLTGSLIWRAIGIICACHLGIDAFLAYSQGTTLVQEIMGLMASMESQMTTLYDGAAVEVQTINAALKLLWPSIYLLASVFEGLCGYLGIWLARKRVGSAAFATPKVVDFDAPLWMVALLVVDAALLALAVTESNLMPSWTLVVSANIAMALRFVVVNQGIAVLMYYACKKHVDGVLFGILAVLGVLLEVQFFILTFIGLVDIWANFRHLVRGEKPADSDSTKQD